MKTRLKEILSNESEMPDDCEVYVHDPLGDMPLLMSLLKKKANAQG